MCVLVVDEIDALAPSRSGSSSQHHIDLLSVILSLVNGNKDVPNLLIFGATNRKENMDSAFLRRIDVKVFIGKPSFNNRQEWLTKRNVLDIMEPDIRKQLLLMTMNFSNDAMNKLIDRIEVRSIHKNDKVSLKDLMELTLDSCKSERIFFGNYFLPKLVTTVPSEESIQYSKLQDFFKLSRTPEVICEGKRFRCTGKVFVDFNSHPNEQIRVEVVKGMPWTENEEYMFHILSKIDIFSEHELVLTEKLFGKGTYWQNLIQNLVSDYKCLCNIQQMSVVTGNVNFFLVD